MLNHENLNSAAEAAKVVSEKGKEANSKPTFDEVGERLFAVILRHVAESGLENESSETKARRLELLAHYILLVRGISGSNPLDTLKQGLSVLKMSAKNTEDALWLKDTVRSIEPIYATGKFVAEKMQSALVEYIRLDEFTAAKIAKALTFPSGLFSAGPSMLVDLFAKVADTEFVQAKLGPVETYFGGLDKDTKHLLADNYALALDAMFKGETADEVVGKLKEATTDSLGTLLKVEHDRLLKEALGLTEERLAA